MEGMAVVERYVERLVLEHFEETRLYHSIPDILKPNIKICIIDVQCAGQSNTFKSGNVHELVYEVSVPVRTGQQTVIEDHELRFLI